MARIYPFRALRYNPSMVRVEEVVTQPYDKITPAMQQAYYQRSLYNLVRIILGLPELFDEPGSNDVYTRAAGISPTGAAWASWPRKKIPASSLTPSVLRCRAAMARFTNGVPLSRLGEVCDYSAQVVFRHEQTLSKPKSDRLNLLRATRAHFGQIFMLYSDPALTAEKILFSGTSAPEIEVTDEYGRDPPRLEGQRHEHHQYPCWGPWRIRSSSSPMATTATRPRWPIPWSMPLPASPARKGTWPTPRRSPPTRKLPS